MSEAMIACQWCGQRITHPFRSMQKFCSGFCSEEFYSAERREAVEWFRSMGLRPTTPQQQERSDA